MKVRIVETERGFCPQVKKFFSWRKIAKRVDDSFGFYEDFGYPFKTFDEAKKVLESYKRFHERRRFFEIRYENKI